MSDPTSITYGDLNQLLAVFLVVMLTYAAVVVMWVVREERRRTAGTRAKWKALDE